MAETEGLSKLQTVITAIICISGLFVIVGFPTVIYLRFEDSATATAQRLSAERSDCARQVNAERNHAIDEISTANARAVLAVLDGLASGGFDPDALESVRIQLNDAIHAVDQLPHIDDEVERRCPNI